MAEHGKEMGKESVTETSWTQSGEADVVGSTSENLEKGGLKTQGVTRGETEENKVEQERVTETTMAVEAEPTPHPVEEKDHSSFTAWEKRFIVFTATIGSFFSPFTTQIYFPALNAIAKDLNVSSSKVNLTVTTYMILQAIAPAFIGGFSDNAGRRPAYMVCFVIYIIADVALAIQKNYVALLVLRMVQSAGSSGTVALANAVVADVATSAERGIYIGITSLAAILGPSLGPILGGVISQYAGWKWIFGFLAIAGAVFFIPLLLFFPETGRTIVGDGTIPPPKWNRSFMNHYNEKRRLKQGIAPDYAERDALAAKRRIRFPNPLATLVVALEPEAACLLFYASIVYAGCYAVMAAMPSQLKDIYGYSDLVVGLMYLPIAGGSLLAAFTNGKLIDWSYQREANRVGIEVKRSKMQDLSKFPIEKARLQVAIPILIASTIFTIIYGWIMHFQTHIAGPCVVLFFFGYTFIGYAQSVSILIVDINPRIPGTATAAFNLVRCLLGAGSTALILPLERAMGTGWAFTFIGLLYVVLSPMLWVVIKWGPSWREKRRLVDERKAREEEERTVLREGVEKV